MNTQRTDADENMPIKEWLETLEEPPWLATTKTPGQSNVKAVTPVRDAPEFPPDAVDQRDASQMNGPKLDNALARAFMLAGNAIFTVVSKKTGTRFTFKLSRPKEEARTPQRRKPIFVGVLSGADNNSDYTYIGQVWEDAEKFTYQVGRKSRVGPDAPSQKAAAWIALALNYPEKLDQCDIYHEGSCGRCGRRLTVPESIRTGFGPECAGRM